MDLLHSLCKQPADALRLGCGEPQYDPPAKAAGQPQVLGEPPPSLSQHPVSPSAGHGRIQQGRAFCFSLCRACALRLSSFFLVMLRGMPPDAAFPSFWASCWEPLVSLLPLLSARTTCLDSPLFCSPRKKQYQ